MKRRSTVNNTLLPLATLVLLVFPHITFAFIEEGVQKLLWVFVVTVFGMFVTLGAMLLNAGIDSFVIGFGGTFNNSGLGVAVNNTWVIIRDFVNLFFIFGLVYIGLRMILDSNNSNTRRWLAKLIIAALFVNFSLFATKFVVDFSNRISAEIAVAGLGAEKGSDGKYTSDVGAELMNRMGLSSILGSGDGDNKIPKDAGWGYIFGTALVLLVSAFVFAAGGILLIIRFAVICFFLIISPIMFASYIIPGFSDTMGRYWKDFLKRCFFAPIYFICLYFAFNVIDGLQTAIGGSGTGNNTTNFANPNLAGVFNNSGNAEAIRQSALGTFPFFILVIIFLVASLVIANRLGAEGAGKALSIGKDLRNRGIRYTKNTGKFAAAQTGGRVARAASEKTGYLVNRDLRSLQQSNNKFVRGIARSNAVEGAVGGAVKSMKNAKFGLGRTIDEDKKMRNQTDNRADNSMAIRDGLRAREVAADGTVEIIRGGDRVRVPLSTLTPAEVAEREKTIAKMQSKVADLSTKDFEALSKDEQLKVAEFLSGSQTDSILKSDNISDEQKGKLTDKQQAAIKKIITENGEILGEKIADLSIRQIETLGDEFITENAALFTDSQFADIKKSKKFTEAQTGRFIGKRKSDLAAKVASNPDSVFKLSTSTTTDPTTGAVTPIYGKNRKVADIAKLPGEVLANPNSIGYLNADVLKAIANGDKDYERVSTTQREEIERLLRDANMRTLGNDPRLKKAVDYLDSPKGQADFIGK